MYMPNTRSIAIIKIKNIFFLIMFKLISDSID